jgi:hypothetical protein
MKNKILTIQGPNITTCIQVKTFLQHYMTWGKSEVYWDTSENALPIWGVPYETQPSTVNYLFYFYYYFSEMPRMS